NFLLHDTVFGVISPITPFSATQNLVNPGIISVGVRFISNITVFFGGVIGPVAQAVRAKETAIAKRDFFILISFFKYYQNHFLLPVVLPTELSHQLLDENRTRTCDPLVINFMRN